MDVADEYAHNSMDIVAKHINNTYLEIVYGTKQVHIWKLCHIVENGVVIQHLNKQQISLQIHK